MTERDHGEDRDYPDGSVGRYVREKWGAVPARAARPYVPPVEPPAPRRVPESETDTRSGAPEDADVWAYQPDNAWRRRGEAVPDRPRPEITETDHTRVDPTHTSSHDPFAGVEYGSDTWASASEDETTDEPHRNGDEPHPPWPESRRVGDPADAGSPAPLGRAVEPGRTSAHGAPVGPADPSAWSGRGSPADSASGSGAGDGPGATSGHRGDGDPVGPPARGVRAPGGPARGHLSVAGDPTARRDDPARSAPPGVVGDPTAGHGPLGVPGEPGGPFARSGHRGEGAADPVPGAHSGAPSTADDSVTTRTGPAALHPPSSMPPGARPTPGAPHPADGPGASYPADGPGAPYRADGAGASYPADGAGASYPADGAGARTVPMARAPRTPPMARALRTVPMARAASYRADGAGASYRADGGGGPHPLAGPPPAHARPPRAAPRDTPHWTDPVAVAAQELQRARSPERTDLSSARLLRNTKRPPQSGWRRMIYVLSGRMFNPGESPTDIRRRHLTARVNQPLLGCYKIAMLSLKGGVGKTTMTATLGATFASLRGDRVVAVDANPDRGTLSQKIPLETSATVRNLLRDAQRVRRYTDVRAYTSQGPSRLEVLASEQDPAVSEAYSEEDYRRTVNLLEHFYNIVLTDCGTGLMHSAMYGVLGVADQLVIVSSGSIDGARSASATMDWLDAHGHGDLVANAVVVINFVHRSRGGVDLDRVSEHFAARCRSVVRIPFDAHLEEGAEIDLDRLEPGTRMALLELAANVADAFERVHSL